MSEELLTMILIGAGIVLLVALVITAIEIIRTVRQVRKVVTELTPQLNETVARVNASLETIEPSLQRLDPLLERVSLTVDAVNLEIMRADQILSDVADVTDLASGTMKKVSGVADAPLNLLTSATDRIRGVFVDKKAEKQATHAILASENAAHAALASENAAPEQTPAAPIPIPISTLVPEPVPGTENAASFNG